MLQPSRAPRSLSLCCLILMSMSFGLACGGGNGPADGSVEVDGAPRDGSQLDGDVGAGVCGDGELESGEVCDDGNAEAGDGCAADCRTVEEDYACIAPGVDCVRVVTCGNARIEGDETCDDRNASAGDGCDAQCRRESGWACPVVGAACIAVGCGDGLVAGFEICDDGGRCNGGELTPCTSDAACIAASDGDTCAPGAGDGCDESCHLEEGFVCNTAGASCTRTACGDGNAEGTEECDDGNILIGDGCTPFCTREPDCMDGTCAAVCGDDVIFAPETCDDGNTIDGDGCSSSCQIDPGYVCEEVPLPDPDSLVIPVVVRDFMPACDGGNDELIVRPEFGDPGASPPYGHPDFQCYGGGETGMVETLLVDGVPVRTSGATRLSSNESFALWYRSNEDYNRTVAQGMALSNTGSGAYRFDSTSFYPLSSPIDGSAVAGFPTEGLEALDNDGNGTGEQNFFFTSEVRFWFEYEGTETLAFSGDDDVWVFVNGHLAVDIGGVHGRRDGSITLNDCDNADASLNNSACLSALDMRVGGIYEAVVFQAERHTTRSQYRLTLTNFARAPSICTSECGDGVLASDEACDEGDMNGASYGGCSDNCRLTPYCGDGVTQSEFGEICDDGLNLGGGPSACAPGCMEVGASCGDTVVQTEQGETCDDGNQVSGDGCSDECRFELF